MPDRRLRPATIAAHAGAGADPETGALSPPLHLTSTYRHGNRGGFDYTRDDRGHPTWALLEATLAALEEGERAVAMSSGLAAIAACVETLPVGARVVAPVDSYSGTRQLLDMLHGQERVARAYVDIADTDAVDAACDGAALLVLESLTNPLLRIPDIRACAAAAHARGALVVVDNTFATPICVRPLTLGADISVHSLSKYAGGHSDAVLGAAIVRDPALAERLVTRRSLGGAIPGQMEAWLVLRGLRTLDVRVRRQMESAAVLAARLAEHPDIALVHHPSLPSHPQHDRARAQMQGGLGAVVSVEIAGGAGRAEAVCEAVTVWQHATSLGGVESTLERRARYPYDAAVVPASLVRLSVGVEDVEDLYDDLDEALRGTRPAG